MFVEAVFEVVEGGWEEGGGGLPGGGGEGGEVVEDLGGVCGGQEEVWVVD